jgi:hypothetical protein
MAFYIDWKVITMVYKRFKFHYRIENDMLIIPPLPEGGGGYTVLPLPVCPSVLQSVQDIFRRIFLSNC